MTPRRPITVRIVSKSNSCPLDRVSRRILKPLLSPPSLFPQSDETTRPHRQTRYPDFDADVEGELQRTIPQGSRNPTTARMPAHNHLLHLQMRDRIGNHSLRTQIGRGQHIGDVAMHKHITGLQAQNGGFRHATVGAADPEYLRGLALGVFFEQGGIVG